MPTRFTSTCLQALFHPNTPTPLQQIDFEKADRFMLWLLFLHWVLVSTLNAVTYGTYLFGFIGGGLLFAIALVSYRFIGGTQLFRNLIGVILMSFTIISIQQHFGRIEMHFHVFIALSFLTRYKDLQPITIAALVSALHHLIFNYLQLYEVTLFGTPITLFNYGCGLDITLLHIFFVIFELMVLLPIIFRISRDFTDLGVTKNNLERLNDKLEENVELRTQELRRVNVQYAEAQELTHLGNWEWNIADNTLNWSDEIYRIFGLEPQSVLPTYELFNHYIHPEDRTKVNNAVQNTVENNALYDITHRIMLNNGELKYVRERGHVFRDAENAPLRMIGSIQEITKEIEIQKELAKSEKKFRIITESTLNGIFIYTPTEVYFNPAMIELTGYSREVLHKKSIWSLFPDELKENIEKALSGISTQETYDELPLLCNHDKIKTVRAHSTSIEYRDNHAILFTLIDITDIKEAQTKIKQLSQVVEQTDDIVKITDSEGIITYVNDAFIAHTGYTRREIIGRSPRLLKSGRHDTEFFESLWQTILRGENFRGVMINRKKDGNIYYEEQTISPIFDEHNQISAYVSTGKDITERMEMEQKLLKMATIDSLTNIYNRQKTEELLDAEIARSKRYDIALSVIMFDIDHFKSINDTYGHDAGDHVLENIAKIVQNNIRNTDIFGRWGGEEFLVVSPHTDDENILLLAEKLRAEIYAFDFDLSRKVSASFGVTRFTSGDTKRVLLKRADDALYIAKHRDRNRVEALFE